jgi:recombination protein RecA
VPNDLTKVLADLNKRFGDNTVSQIGTMGYKAVERISSGSLSLDIALGGGIPRGRIIEIYGPESSGKSTLCLHIIAEAQKLGGTCAFIDMEHALDIDYAKALKIDIEALCFSQPDSGEIALEVTEGLVRSGLLDVVVVDSVAALVPQKEIEGDMGDAPMGLQARLMSQALRKLSGAISSTNTIVVFTNQLRQKIGVMFGNPETTTGGMALKFYATQRLDIRRIQAIKDGENIVGGRTRVKVVKNKVAPPFRVAEFDILYGKGISRSGEILDLGVDLGILTKRGSYFYYGDVKIGQGKENARELIDTSPELAAQLESAIIASAVERGNVLKSADE